MAEDSDTFVPEPISESGASEAQVVALLRDVLELPVPLIRAEYDPESPFGYAYPQVQDRLGLTSSQALSLLEDLERDMLLDARLHDKIHLCPSCGWHTVNFIEVCPRCEGLDIDVETVLHHFACGCVGTWTEFRQGVDLICPGCSEPLRHLGLDYEKPTDTYVCQGCHYTFTDSRVIVRCLNCDHVADASAVQPRRIYNYAPTTKADRAVQAGRIHDLDIAAVLQDARSRGYRRDFLIYTVNRETYRARRYNSSLSLMLIDVAGLLEAATQRGGVDPGEVREEIMARAAETLRDLDVPSMVGDRWVAILLPETPLAGARHVAERVGRDLTAYQAISLDEPVPVTIAVGELGEEHLDGKTFFDFVQDLTEWAVGNRPGMVVTPEDRAPGGAQ